MLRLTTPMQHISNIFHYHRSPEAKSSLQSNDFDLSSWWNEKTKRRMEELHQEKIWNIKKKTLGAVLLTVQS